MSSLFTKHDAIKLASIAAAASGGDVVKFVQLYDAMKRKVDEAIDPPPTKEPTQP